jgi:hypothetical protein
MDKGGFLNRAKSLSPKSHNRFIDFIFNDLMEPVHISDTPYKCHHYKCRILITVKYPARLWIDLLDFLSKKKAGKITSRPFFHPPTDAL